MQNIQDKFKFEVVDVPPEIIGTLSGAVHISESQKDQDIRQKIGKRHLN